jgi:hypothetical protein
LRSFSSKSTIFWGFSAKLGLEPGTFRAKWEPLYHRPLLHDLFWNRGVEHLIINQKYTPPRDPGVWKPQKNRIVPNQSTPGLNQKRPRISGLIDFNNAQRPRIKVVKIKKIERRPITSSSECKTSFGQLIKNCNCEKLFRGHDFQNWSRYWTF